MYRLDRVDAILRRLTAAFMNALASLTELSMSGCGATWEKAEASRFKYPISIYMSDKYFLPTEKIMLLSLTVVSVCSYYTTRFTGRALLAICKKRLILDG